MQSKTISSARAARLAREVELFQTKPPWGISCRPEMDDKYDILSVNMRGPRNSPYENGIFKLTITIPERYPFEPPLVKFITRVYHPNIDKAGRICMDMLKMPPKGAWLPTITLESLLISLQTLMANPNPDDPLMMDVAIEYKSDREAFLENARAHTKEYACKDAMVYAGHDKYSIASKVTNDTMIAAYTQNNRMYSCKAANVQSNIKDTSKAADIQNKSKNNGTAAQNNTKDTNASADTQNKSKDTSEVADAQNNTKGTNAAADTQNKRKDISESVDAQNKKKHTSKAADTQDNFKDSSKAVDAQNKSMDTSKATDTQDNRKDKAVDAQNKSKDTT